MVLEAGDHQKTQEDIDFMLINGLIIILHRFSIQFLCFHWKIMPEKTAFFDPVVYVYFFNKSFNLLCLRRPKSIFSSDFQAARPKVRIFLYCSYSPGTYLEKRAVKNGVVSAQGFLCTTSERRVMKVLSEQQNFGPNVVYYFLHNYRCVVIMGFQIISQRANQFVWFNIITITTTTSWCTRGVGKTRFQQSGHDTLRDGRKGDPQHKCCGKKTCVLWQGERAICAVVEYLSRGLQPEVL